LLVNNTDVWVIADVDDEDISRVHIGQTVKVLCEAYQDRTFSGEVVRVGGAAMPKGVGRVKAKIVRVKIHVTNAAPLLKPGMAVDIEADAEVKKKALLVPADAVVEEATETFIYVVRDGRAHRTVVETGFSNYTQTEIIAGLSPGDRVVVSGKDELSDGVRVRPRAAPDNSEELSKAGGS
jgi:RND family efflux transporter MFP subunit